jgi:hypothetical protein
MTRSWWRTFWSALRLAPHTVATVAAAHRRVRGGQAARLAGGDIVFRLGLGEGALGPLIGNLGIAGSSLGPYAHIAMVVAVDERQPSRSLVVEATRAVGVRLLSLGEFVGDSIYAGIFHPALDATVRQAAVAYALAQVGLAYDETFGLDDPLGASEAGGPTGHYCSGLIWSAYRAGGVDIAAGRRTIYRSLPLRVCRRLYNLMPERELVLPNDIFYALLAQQVAAKRSSRRFQARVPARRHRDIAVF